MPLFNSTDIKSKEVAALFSLADLMSRCGEFIELSGTADAAEAYKKISVGPVKEPFDSEEYSIDELAELFFVCQIASSDEEGMEAARPITDAGSCAAVGGTIEVYLRRYVRQSEINDSGANNIFLFFKDRVSAIQVEMMELSMAENDIRIGSVVRTQGPHCAGVPEAVGQGEYIWATLDVTWGELDLNSGTNTG